MKRLIFIGLLFIAAFVITTQLKTSSVPIHNGELWSDTDGTPMNAHGAGILEYDGTYYMFGEIKKGPTWQVPEQSWEDYRAPAGGVACYSSTNLVKWKKERIALNPVVGDPATDLDTGRVIERPTVIYNRKTKKFVMWIHIDKNDYSYSRAGVAVSDRPEGPYKYLGSVQPNGQMVRDMTVFKDEDDKAYLIYASESNKTMQVCLLSDDYLEPTTTYSRILSAHDREAPAVFKYKNMYYLVTSGCTGWSPNPATWAITDNLLGEWKQMGDPCRGPGSKNTFQSQSTFILPFPGNKDLFVFMADRWNKTNLEDSRYVWLPLKMINGEPEIRMVKDK